VVLRAIRRPLGEGPGPGRALSPGIGAEGDGAFKKQSWEKIKGEWAAGLPPARSPKGAPALLAYFFGKGIPITSPVLPSITMRPTALPFASRIGTA
jgi:hypothetical protein